MIINGVYICGLCNSTITNMTQEIIKFHEAKCNEWAQSLGKIKSIVQSDTGELWTTITLNEYMKYGPDFNYVPPKISKFKRWRTEIAKTFWTKVHKMAENHGADCDRYY
jgi:hypothetical protein